MSGTMFVLGMKSFSGQFRSAEGLPEQWEAPSNTLFLGDFKTGVLKAFARP